MIGQADFLGTVDQANQPKGSYWVEIGEGHRVHQPGERWLVVEEQADGWLLCWPGGRRPPDRVLGNLIHRRYTR